MNEQNNQIIIENSSNKKEENKNISPNDKDYLKLSQSGNKLFNKDENSTFNIKSSIKMIVLKISKLVHLKKRIGINQ